MATNPQLIVPVYLNQRAVFDLVAMLQGGISTVTKVSETAHESKASERQVGAAFGLNKAFASLLRIDLSGKLGQSGKEETGRTSNDERVHTPASLFFTLRGLLLEKNLLLQDNDQSSPKPGDFLEFSASLSRNPIIETVDALFDMMSVASIFSSPGSSQQKKGKAHLQDEHKAQLKQLEQFREKLRSGDTVDLATDPLLSTHRAVITVETQYLNDPSMADLVDGTFTVLGKVTRVLAQGEGGVSLIRNTALGKMPPLVLEQLFSALNALSTEQGFNLPIVSWQIAGPVIQLLPIAIYA